jgi:hypothetical protein
VPEIPQFILDRSRATEAIFTADEVGMWPDGLLDQLVANGVLQATANARSVTCDACGEDHVEEVQYIEAPPGSKLRAYIWCPLNGPVAVPLERLRCWAVNPERIPPSLLGARPAIPSPGTPASPSNMAIPHAISVAYGALATTLDDATDMYTRTTRFPNPAPVIAAIERFVHEVKLVPEWFAELQRRVHLVESSCGKGSQYAVARQRALSNYTASPEELCRGKLGIDRLRNPSTDCPVFLAEVVEVRNSIEAVLNEPSLGLTSDATNAFAKWQDSCRKVQQEAERLEVDGCWYLYHVFSAAEAGCSERSQVAKAMIETDVGGANLDSIRAAVHSLAAWIRESGVAFASQEQATARSRGPKNRDRNAVPKRSWTQSDLDDAIQEYKAKRASTYTDLVEGVKCGRAGAKKSAQKLFGRNALARALGVRSPAMVTNSPVWQRIANELRLRGRSRKGHHAVKQRIGVDIALEEQAIAAGGSAVDEVVRRETIALIEKSMPSAEAEATVEKLQRGDITDDQARDLIKLTADQKRDDRARKIRPDL